MRLIDAAKQHGSPPAVNVALASSLAVWGLIEVLPQGSIGSSIGYAVATAAMTVPLAWSRTQAVIVATIMSTAITAQSLVANPPESVWTLIAVLVAAYSLAANVPNARWSLLSLLPLAAAMSLSIVEDPSDSATNIVPTLLVFLGGPWIAGRTVHRRDIQAAELTSQMSELERDQHRQTQAAVGAERSRIARELHDIVAHGLSVIAIQADAAEARLLIGEESSKALEPLGAIKRTARESLGEMRHLLGLLRGDDSSFIVEPHPGLEAISTLVDQVRTAGLTASVDVTGRPEKLAPGLELAAYRIVQESLTNTLKHAAASEVQVSIDYGDDGLEVAVRDNGSGASRTRKGSGGHGICGMRERVALYGGHLQAGPRPEGGFEVVARMPK